MKPLSSSTVDTAASRPAAMRFILLTVLIDMVSIGLIIPVLPELVGHFTTDRAEQAFWYGAIMLSFGVANFFFAPILGGLSDQFGRRPVLLIGFCGFAFSFFATALATQLWMLIAIRIVSGALQANASVANAYVADITAPEDRAKRFGQLGAMFGLGFILGPVMGGLLGAIDIRLPFFAAGGLALLNLAYGYFVLPILHRGQLIGRLDAKAHRALGTFEVKALFLEPGVKLDDEAIVALASAISQCAAWHATPKVEVTRTSPSALRARLRKALSHLSP